MEYTNQSTLRAQMQEFQQWVLQVLQAAQMGTIPPIGAVKMIDDMGETLNIKKAGMRYLQGVMPAPGMPQPGAAPGGNPQPTGRTAPGSDGNMRAPIAPPMGVAG